MRVGREILWHGDMEDEGATFWNLNSSSEVYDDTVYHQGHRSLRQKRTSSNTGPVTTDLEGFPPTRGGTEFSICGWMKTQGAKDAGFTARFFQGRGGSPLQSTEAGSLVQGTHDWSFLWTDTQVPENASFFNLQPHLDKPDTGENYAWFDELRLIEWEPWQPGGFPLTFSRPSNLRYLQVRFSQAADSVHLVWEDVVGGDIPSGLTEGLGSGGADRLQLSAPQPNPSRSNTRLDYRLPQAGRVRLMILDVQGRRIAVLADGPQTAGPHRAQWRTEGVPSGLYFCRLEAGSEVRTQKIVVLR